MESCCRFHGASELRCPFWGSHRFLPSHRIGSLQHFPVAPRAAHSSALSFSNLYLAHSMPHASCFSAPSLSSSGFSRTLASPFQPSTTPSYRLAERWVCFGGGKRLRRPRIWKTRQRRGSINKSEKLLESIQSISNVKEEVYGALDAFVAWELDFPLIPVKKALRTLEAQQNWMRIIQVSKWMLGKGQGRTLNTYSLLLKALSEEGRIDEAQELYKKIFSKHVNYTPLSFILQILKLYKRFEMDEDILEVFADMEELEMKLDTEMVKIVSDTYEKLGMSDKAERVRLKYPPPAYRWRLIDGKTRRFPIKSAFTVNGAVLSLEGTSQHEYIQSDLATVENDEDYSDEEAYDSFNDEDIQGLDEADTPAYDDSQHEKQLQI